MARSLAIQPNLNNSDPANYPLGRIKDNTGFQDGTAVDESVYGDIHQNLIKIMLDAGFVYNGQPDNVTNGYQLYEALMSLAGKNDLIKQITILNATTLNVPIKIQTLKIDEAVTFVSNFDSDVTHVLIRGTDLTPKALTITGDFKAGQKVQILNKLATIEIYGLYDSSYISDLKDRFETLEASILTFVQKLSIFTVGGAMFIWNKPLNEIPDGYQEVLDFKGKTVFGFDVTNPLFNVIGAGGGSVTKTIAKANLPNVKLKVFPSGDRYGENGVPQAGFFSSSGDSSSGGSTFVETEALGSGTALDVLNPYRIVAFIEWATV